MHNLHLLLLYMDELANDIKKGSERAFNRFFHLHHYQVVRYVRYLLRDQALAEDIAQEVFIKVWNSRSQIDPNRSIKAWLFTIVSNTVSNFIRKELTEKKYRMASAEQKVEPFTQNAGEDRLGSRDASRIFANAVSELPPAFVRCLLLHRQHGLSYRQIAELEGISIKAVEKRISTTLRHLRSAPGWSNHLALFVLFQAPILF